MCPAPTHPNGRSSSSQLCLLSIRGDPGLWLAAPFALGGDERGGVTRGGQTVRLVLGPAPSFCADSPSGAQLDSGAGVGVQISLGIGRRVERGQGRVGAWCQTEIQFLAWDLEVGITWDGAGILSVISEPWFCLGDPAAGSGPCVSVF